MIKSPTPIAFTSPAGYAHRDMLDAQMRRPAKVAVEMVECAYCSRDVPVDGSTPALDDDATWTDLAAHHLPSCEWILTRAHRRDVPALTPAETAEIERQAIDAAR